ncbi:protein kinase domain-containing protein [Streptomyces sp. WC2508]|uniref:protein kinase domain-containing protein n=1 Tax=Streptomyces sp. WC2508 TaxID=3461405 RepID=UPI004044912A
MTDTLREAVRYFWAERRHDEVRRSPVGSDVSSVARFAAVRHPWDRLTESVIDALVERGVDRSWIQVGPDATLPGAYGLSGSAWDLVVRKDGIPLAAATFTQLGGQPGSINNINNRIRELTASAFSVRQHVSQEPDSFQPCLGLFFVLEETDRMNAPTRRPGERGAERSGPSQKQRLSETFGQFYSDGLYDVISYVSATGGEDPSLEEPNPDMSIEGFIKGFAKRTLSHVADTSPPQMRSDLAEVPPHLYRYREVLQSAQGAKKDYSMDRIPIEEGGQAAVFRAVHKRSGIKVAFKRRLSQRENASARMRREVEISQLLNSHLNFMPILDFEHAHKWFIMPLAEATAEEQHEKLRKTEQLRDLVNCVGSVLAEAHRQGWMHRDIKPSNILLLDGRWTLADWGVVRRPLGQTTKIGRTGHFIGTEGFAAPELFIKPHDDATPASDIYSLGRVIAWALTGEMPQTNIDLLPPPGPWRNIVKGATQHEPERRPQDIEQLLRFIEREFSEPEEPPTERAPALLAAANAGDSNAADSFLELITDHPDDYELYIHVLPQLSLEFAAQSMSRNPRPAISLMRAMAALVNGDGANLVQFGEAACAVTWLHGVAANAARRNEWDLLDEAIRAMCQWDGTWDQWSPQDAIRSWLRTLRGDVANIVAPALRDHPGSARHFAMLVDDRTVNHSIRQAIRAATEQQR